MDAAYVEVSVRVPRAQAGLVESLLQSQGALAVTLSDCGDAPLWEPGVGETPLWDEVTVAGLFEGGVDEAPLTAAVSLAPGVGAPEQVRVAPVSDRDWVRAWMDRFRPMRFGKSLWIVPGGQSCPDPDATILHLDPGLAFGTGTHATTRQCLEWIDAHDLRDKNVLDFGCGSGVLGLAAALMGAARVWCVDNDPQALAATEANARRNGLLGQMVIETPETLSGQGFDLCLANILSGVLMANARFLAGVLHSGGDLVLAGVMAGQQSELMDAYSALGIDFRAVDEEGGWVRLHGVKQ